MEDYTHSASLHGTNMSDHDPTTPTQAPSLVHSQDTLPETLLATPGTSQISEPPTQPPNPPKIRIKRRRAIFPPSVQPFAMESSNNPSLPTIETSDLEPTSPSLPITPISGLRRDLLHTTSSAIEERITSPPRTPVHQIYPSVEHDQTPTHQTVDHLVRAGEEIERPSSALSIFSDSSATSRDSSESGPSFGGSCTSPESESADPFIFNDIGLKSSKLSAPFQSTEPKHPRKRQKMHKKIKWTNEMDDHLWMTYMVYLSDPTVTPFKTLPGSAPPLGVCHRVAREAKRSWKGPRNVLHSIDESEPSRQRFTSLDATVMRDVSAPPSTGLQPMPLDTIERQPLERSHSSNEILRKPMSRWPRSEASTRRRLRELCKHKPMLPPHYQRLMQTRTPSPFESSSSRPKARSSHISPPPIAHRSSESSFSTRDLNITLATSSSTTMQPGGPLSQLASDIETPHPAGTTSSTHSSIRGAHQKSQSLQLTLGVGREWSNSLKRLASPFREFSDHQASSSASQETPSDSGTAMDRDSTPIQQPKLDSPLHIHAPRPMSGSMKRRAEYQLGEELNMDDINTRRNFLEDFFSDGHRRVRSRGFSLGAMRQVAPQPLRHLSDLFTRPTATEEAESQSCSILSLYSQGADTNGNDRSMSTRNNDNNTLAPPAMSSHSRRLGSPFAPNPPSSYRNTFPRSMFPHGLESISNFDSQAMQQDHAHDGSLSSSHNVEFGEEQDQTL